MVTHHCPSYLDFASLKRGVFFDALFEGPWSSIYQLCVTWSNFSVINKKDNEKTTRSLSLQGMKVHFISG